MKKVLFLIVSIVILGLVFAGCGGITNITAPSSSQKGVIPTGPGTLSVVSDEDVMITMVYNNKDYTGALAVPTSQYAVLAWEPDPYPNIYLVEPPEATDSTWDNGVNWFEDNLSSADWIWETHVAKGPENYDSLDPLFDTDASISGRVVLFEATFDVPGTPTSATLRIAADNGYEAWVNVGTHHYSSTVSGDGWEISDLHEADLNTTGWQAYGTITIDASELVTGSNTLYVLAGNEYFAANDGNTPIPASLHNPGAVIFQLDVAYEEGNPDIEVVKVCPPEFAFVGDTLTYNYTVNNTGDGALLNVTLVDDQLGSITLSGLTDEDGDLVIDDLAEGASATGTADYVVLKGDTILLNTATASSTSEIDDSPVEATSDECMVEICYEETAFGGETEGLGKAWWFYFDTSENATQTIWAGQHYNAGEVTVSECDEGEVTITIELADGWYLQDDDESVKIQGYADASVPTKRQPAGKFETYKGNETIVTVDCFDNYVIQLDVQHCGEFVF